VALGEPDAARALIEAWEESSPAVERDAATTAQVRLATVYLVRRMRWRGLRDSLVLTLATSGSPEQALAARATQVLLGRAAETQAVLEKTTDGSIGEENLRFADISWRTARALNARDAAVLLNVVASNTEDARDDPVLAAHLELDRWEARVMGRRIGQTLSYQAGDRAEEAVDVLERRLMTGAGTPADATQLRAIRLREWAQSASEWTTRDEMTHDWAEAALEEGELLALRIPQQGRRLLNLAVRLFDESGDLTAATQSAITGVIALYHAGTAASARTALRELEPRYDRVRAMSASSLPAWPELVAWSRAHSDDDPVGGAWDGWLLRLAACSKPDSVQSPEAAELDLSPVRRRKGLPARLEARLPDIAMYTIGGSVWVVLGAWGGRTALSALGWYPPPIVGLAVGGVGIFVAFCVVILVIALAVTLLAPPLTSLIGAQLRLHAAVDPVLSPGSLDQAAVRLRIQGTRMNLDMISRLRRVTTPWLAVYLRRQGAAPLLPLRPDPLRTSLPPVLIRALRRARALHADELTLRIGPKAVSGAWEAMIGLNQVTAAGDDIDRYFRNVRVYPARKPRPATAVDSRVTVLCPRPFALFAEESWEAGGIRAQLLHSSEELRKFDRAADAEVLHLIGTPVSSELGPELTLDGSAAQALQPDRLPVANPFLVIVQAEPARSSVSADARSDILRVIAHDIAEASGGAAVLMIPALPSHVAVNVMQEVARALEAGQPDRRALLTLAQRLRMIVFTAGDSGAAVAARALPAFDLCLYAGE
jgi:hypothetical protein